MQISKIPYRRSSSVPSSDLYAMAVRYKDKLLAEHVYVNIQRITAVRYLRTWRLHNRCVTAFMAMCENFYGE